MLFRDFGFDLWYMLLDHMLQDNMDINNLGEKAYSKSNMLKYHIFLYDPGP